MTASQFFDELPYRPPLFATSKGDAAVNLVMQKHDRATLKWLASLQRGAGRAALATITEAADRHGVTLELMAKPGRPMGAGKRLPRKKLEAFYAGFGFAVAGRDSDGFARMVRESKRPPLGRP